MKEIFLKISDKILADVPSIRYVDFDLGQLDEEMPPVSYPCALINISKADFQDLSQGVQQGEVLVTILLAFRTYERTNNLVAQNHRAIGLKHLDTIEEVNTALSGLSGETFDDLNRRSYIQEPRSDIKVYALTYESLYTSDPECPYVVDPDNQPNLCIDVEID